MRLKALTLENFKGIREPVRVEFAPLTLLFGPNNAGKSTIVQALMYAREVLERGNCDARKTELGGDAVDLGGFLNLVHGNDRERVIRMRFELDLSIQDELRFGEYTNDGCFFRDLGVPEYDESYRKSRDERLRQADGLAGEALDWPGICWVEFRVGLSSSNRPEVLSYAVGEGVDPYATIDRKSAPADADAPESSSASLTLDFTARPFGRCIDDAEEVLRLWNDLPGAVQKHADSPWALAPEPEPLGPEWQSYLNTYDEDAPVCSSAYVFLALEGLPVSKMPSTLFVSWLWYLVYRNARERTVSPINGQPISVLTGRSSLLPDWSNGLRLYKTGGIRRIRDIDLDRKDRKQSRPWVRSAEYEFEQGIDAFLSEIVVSPGIFLIEELRGAVFLSAQRATPDRDYHSNKVPGSAEWWNGLSAWDELIEDEHGLVGRVNAWLSGPDALDSGHEVQVRRYIELPLEDPNVGELRNPGALSSIDLRALRDTVAGLPEQRRIAIRNNRSGARITPRDVGAGLAQIIPVIVAALRSKGNLTVLEEPESKMHPAFQMVLADLLLYAAIDGSREPILRALANRNPWEREEEAIEEARKKTRPQFIVETHSEHLILRCLRRIRETEKGLLPPDIPSVAPGDVAVHFVNPGPDGARIKRIEIDEDGDFIDEWPGGFFEESFNEKFAGR